MQQILDSAAMHLLTPLKRLCVIVHSVRLAKWILPGATLFLALCGPCCAAEIFRCTDAAGKTTYSDKKCIPSDSCSRWDGRKWSPDACKWDEFKQPPPAEPPPLPSKRSEPQASASPARSGGGTQRIVRDHAFGCQSREIFDRIVSLAAQGDDEATKRALVLGLASGNCKAFEIGDEVYLDDTALFSGLVKLRPAGSVAGYWTNMENTK